MTRNEATAEAERRQASDLSESWIPASLDGQWKGRRVTGR
jgi:hypothetical protein